MYTRCLCVLPSNSIAGLQYNPHIALPQGGPPDG